MRIEGPQLAALMTIWSSHSICLNWSARFGSGRPPSAASFAIHSNCAIAIDLGAQDQFCALTRRYS